MSTGENDSEDNAYLETQKEFVSRLEASNFFSKIFKRIIREHVERTKKILKFMEDEL